MAPRSLAGQDEQLLAGIEHSRRIPVRRDTPEEFVSGDREDGDGVVVPLGDVELRLVGRQRQCIRRAPLGRRIRCGVAERGHDLLLLRIEDGDAIEAAEGDVEPRAGAIGQQRRRMAADRHAAGLEERAVATRAVHGDRVATPRRDVDPAVRCQLDRVRIVVGRQAIDHFPLGQVEHGQVVADVLDDVEILAVARHRHTGRIARAALVLFLLADDELALEGRGAVLPAVAVDRVVVAAGDVERFAVGRERRAIERRILRERLRDLPRGDVDDLDPLLAEAAENHDELLPARCREQRQRQATQLHGLADRVESDARGDRLRGTRGGERGGKDDAGQHGDGSGRRVAHTEC